LFDDKIRQSSKGDEGDVWGKLTRRQVYDCLPPGTLAEGLTTWARMRPAIGRLSEELKSHLREVAAAKETARKIKQQEADAKYQAKRRAARHVERNTINGIAHVDPEEPFRSPRTCGEYLSIPTDEEKRARIAAFIDSTGNDALSRRVCIVCARELMRAEGK